MHFAILHRMARQVGRPLAGWAIRRCRVASGIIIVGGALLLNTNALYAQSAAPVRTPIEGIMPQISPESAAAASSAAASATDEQIHVIAAGDTLSNVAQRYGVKVADLAAYNEIRDHNHIVIGQKLHIPPAGVAITEPAPRIGTETLPGAGGYHVVRQGESLSAIARLYSLTLEELMALNAINEPNLVRMGTMLRLTDEVEPPGHGLYSEASVITHTVKAGESLAEIAQIYFTTAAQIVADNKLDDENVRAGQELRIRPPAGALEAFGVDAPIDGERKIVIDLGDQSLTAFQGDVVVLHTIVSTGKAATPTRRGEFTIFQKLESQHMSGEGYDLPGVPWVMYYDGEMAIHGADHANFGIPTSHGCTNMPIPESRALYAWASLGTRVIVQL